MTYVSAYELETGDILTDVSALCRHAARNQGSFSQATIPTLSSVERWITASSHWVAGLLRRSGLAETYTDDAVGSILQQLVVYDVCAKVELSLPAENSTGEPNQRFQEFTERRREIMEMITDGTIVGLEGLQRAPYITGISISRKRVSESDWDATQHRIRRGGFQNPGIGAPLSETGMGGRFTE